MRLLPVLALAMATSCTPPAPQQNAEPDPPTFQKATAVSGGTRVSWRNATDEDGDATVVVRYAYVDAKSLDGKPAGKTLPARGDAFGSGTVVYVGLESGFTDLTLPTGCARLAYQLWSHDAAGQWSAGGVYALTVPGGKPGPSTPPTTFTATLGSTSAELTWAAAPGSTKTKVVRTLGTPAPSPDVGVVVYEGDDTQAAEPISTLPVGVNLFYSAFACNDCGACATLSASATLLVPRVDAGIPDAGHDEPDAGSPLQPLAMSAALSGNGFDVNLSWTNPPSSTGFTQVKVVRMLNALPTGPDDAAATLVFAGNATSTSEKLDKLLPTSASGARTYFYVAYGCANASCEQHGSRATFAATVTQALHAGGYTVCWRHASASWCGDRTDLGQCSCTSGVCTNCPANNWWKSCDRNMAGGTCVARQLGDFTTGDLAQPNTETSTIHNQFASKGIVVSKVMSSEMCRAKETATGFNFGPAVELRQDITYFVYDEANRCNALYALLNEPPTQGTNTAMVSHAGFFSNCNVLSFLAWGEGAIFKPNPGGTAIFIQQVPYNAWANLP